MAYDPVSRRHFLKGLGGATVALPFLPSLLPRQAWGSASAPMAKRFIAIHNGHCQAVEQWLPNPAQFAFTQQASFARSVPLSSIQGPISPVLGTAFDSLRGKLLLLSRLDPTSTNPNHNAEVILSGGVRSEITDTLDQVLASKLTGAAPFNLYVRSVFDSNYSGASQVSVSKGNYSTGQFNPSTVFANLFGTTGANGSTAASAANTKIQRRNLATVDLVLKQFQTLRANKQLSKTDADRLDQHMALIAQTEKKLSGTTVPTTLACGSPTGPVNSPTSSTNAADYQVVIDQMFDVIELGVKCGQIKVATLMMHVYDYFSGSVGFISGVGSSVDFHTGIGHAGSSDMRVMKQYLNAWFGQRVARFLTNLDVVEDPTTGKTYLDNSLILWANDQGAVNNTGAHASINLPVLLAGGAGGFLKTGQYVDYGPAYTSYTRAIGGDEGSYQRGRPYNQLLVTILQAMGLQPSDYETGGNQGFGVYGSLVGNYNYLPDNHRRTALPLITA